MTDIDDEQDKTPFSDFDANAKKRQRVEQANYRLSIWKEELEFIHELLVDANIHAFNGKLLINLDIEEWRVPNIALGNPYSLIVFFPGGVENTFTIVNYWQTRAGGGDARKVKRNEIIPVVKEMLLNWVDSETSQWGYIASRNIPDQLSAIVDGNIINLNEFPLMNLYCGYSNKYTTWSPINPANKIIFYEYIASGHVIHSERTEHSQTTLPDNFIIETIDGNFDLMRINQKIMKITSIHQSGSTYTFDIAKNVYSIERIQNLINLGYSLKVDNFMQILPKPVKGKCFFCNSWFTKDEYPSHLEQTHKIIVTQKELNILLSTMFIKRPDSKYPVNVYTTGIRAKMHMNISSSKYWCPFCEFPVSKKPSEQITYTGHSPIYLRNHLEQCHNISLTDKELVCLENIGVLQFNELFKG